MTINNLYYLFQAFDSRNSIFLLGAGASAGLVPFTNELGESIIDIAHKKGGFPVERIPFDDVARRVFRNLPVTDDPVRQVLPYHIYQSAQQAIILKKLLPQALPYFVPQYQIFNWANHPVLLNLNVDGIAKKCCKNLLVFEPHGSVPYQLVNSPIWDSLIDDLLEYGFELPKIPGDVLLPIREPPDILSRNAYKRLKPYFGFAKYTVLIGYSFGLHEGAFDDYWTFNYLCEQIRNNPMKLVSIGLSSEVPLIVQDTMGHKDTHIVIAYWNCLTRALFEIWRKKGCPKLTVLFSYVPEIVYRYEELCNKEF